MIRILEEIEGSCEIQQPPQDDNFFDMMAAGRMSGKRLNDQVEIGGDDSRLLKKANLGSNYCSWTEQQELFLAQQVLNQKAHIKTNRTKEEKFSFV